MGAYLNKNRQHVAEDMKHIFQMFPRLQEREVQKAGTLSGGEQQMLAMGRALMSRPRLLLLDEPSLGLAPLVVHTIFEAIDEIRGKGTTILLVEQNAHAALKHSDRAYVLETGRIVMEGSSKDLAADPGIKEAYLGE
jgi:branched-chain amino acid transport system ATP-binding protein